MSGDRVGRESGFSLLELMVVLIVLLVITGAIFNSLTGNQKTFDAELANAEAQENARSAINAISEIIKTSGNNPNNLLILNGLNFVTLYSSFDASTKTGTAATIPSNCGGTSGVACPSGPAIELKSDFDGDGRTQSDVNTNPANQTIFSSNIITSEDIIIYLDNTDGRNLVQFHNLNAPGGPQTSPIAEFVTDLQFTIDSTQNLVTINLTARSNRAASVEATFERRFRYSNIVSVVRLRNRN